MGKLTEKQIKKAVLWWVGVIQSPKFNNGDISSNGFITTALANTLKEPISSDRIAKFIEIAGKKLRTHPEATQGLHSDYGAHGLLAEIIQEAGIPEGNIPYKTNMMFYDGEVEVSYGYGNSYEKI